MQKTTLTTAKFSKLGERIHELKVKLMNTNYWLSISDIDERYNSLFEIYMNDNNRKEKDV